MRKPRVRQSMWLEMLLELRLRWWQTRIMVSQIFRLVIAAVAVFVPAAALACSCGVFDEDVDMAELRAWAATAEHVVAGEIVGATDESGACRATPTPLYRTLRVHEAIRGEVPATIEVRVGTIEPSEGDGCSVTISSCDVTPAVGTRGVWAIERQDDEWTFARVCLTHAVRRAIAAERGVTLEALGGEADSVRRRHGTAIEDRVIEDIFGDELRKDAAEDPETKRGGPEVSAVGGDCRRGSDKRAG